MLIDEILAVGDESFQRKCMARIAERMAAGTTLVLVSHDPSAIERICRRVVVLDDGKVAFDGDDRRRAAVLPPAAGHRRGRARGRCARTRPSARSWRSPSSSWCDAGGQPRARVPHRRGAGRADDACARWSRRSGRWWRWRCATSAARCASAPTRRSASWRARPRCRSRVPRLNLLGGDYDVAVGRLRPGRAGQRVPGPGGALLGGPHHRRRGRGRPARHVVAGGPAGGGQVSTPEDAARAGARGGRAAAGRRRVRRGRRLGAAGRVDRARARPRGSCWRSGR